MRPPVIALSLIAIFFLVLGVYMKIRDVSYSGTYMSDQGWEHSVMNGNFVLLLSFATMLAVIFIIRRNKK